MINRFAELVAKAFSQKAAIQPTCERTLYAEVSTCSSKKGERISSTQLKLSQSIEKSQKYTSTSPQGKEFDHAVADYIAKDAQPLSTVDRPGFMCMVTKLNPRYQLPSRKHFSNTEIPQLYYISCERICCAAQAVRG